MFFVHFLRLNFYKKNYLHKDKPVSQNYFFLVDCITYTYNKIYCLLIFLIFYNFFFNLQVWIFCRIAHIRTRHSI